MIVIGTVNIERMDPGQRMDLGQDPTAGFFSGLIVIGTINITGALSDLVPSYTVVQHWLLATDHDCIAVGLSLSLSIHAV